MMIDFMIDTFGVYTPILVSEGVYSPDWSYILSVIIFIVVLYSVLKIVGLVIRR